MIKLFNDSITELKRFFSKTDDERDRLLETIYSSVLLAEKDYNEAITTIEKKIKKEQILHLLISITSKLIRSKLDSDILSNDFNNLLELLDVDCIYLSKYKNNTFKVVKRWSHDECLELLEFKDEFIGAYNEFGTKRGFHKCSFNSRVGECAFPIEINGKLWGAFVILKYLNNDRPKECCYNKFDFKCYWNSDQIYICSILSSIIASHIKTYKLIDELKQQSNIIFTTASMVKIFTWSKDEFGKYIYCSPEWKETFFDLNRDVDISGKTDIELLNGFRERTGKEHTYGNVCKSSDEHCIQQGKTCYYLEAGYIGGKLFLLDVRKTPLYTDGRIRGTVGIAKDLSDNEYEVKKMLSYYINKGIVENLNPENMYVDDVVAYWIKTEDTYNDILKGILPR